VLTMSRTNLGGINIGLGALLNLLVLAYTAYTCITQKATSLRSMFLRLWVFYLAVVFFSVVISPQKTYAFRMWLNVTSYFCMSLLPFFLIRSLESRNHWIKHLFFSSIIPIVLANVDLLKGGSVDWSGMRVSGTFPHPNVLGFYLVLIIVIVFTLMNSSRMVISKGLKVFLWFYMVNLFVLLLFTKTRNAWLACWIFFFVYGLFKDKKYLFFTIGLPPLLMLIPEFAYRITELLQGQNAAGTDQLNSWSWRVNLWKDSMVWIARNPFFGYGFTSFKYYSQQFSEMAVGGGSGAHNVYVETLFETGLFGLVAFCSLYINLIVEFLRRLRNRILFCPRESAIVLSYVISYALVCFADNMQYYLVLNWFVWFFIGCMLVPVEKERKEQQAL
ncbi:MAG: O-antigen ligase family protein, partial [Candidatus Omnitrophica bacterium]|nr:O-antigen ligase family protein [Candidatus Omnitrophota bacterium]